MSTMQLKISNLFNNISVSRTLKGFVTSSKNNREINLSRDIIFYKYMFSLKLVIILIRSKVEKLLN